MDSQSPIQKISTIDTKHDAMIHDAQYDYYGKRVATCSSDGYIKIFDVSKPETTVRLASFKAHNGPVWQLSWAHPKYGNLLASCGFDKKVSVWKEIKTNEWVEVISHTEHQGSVNSVVWAPWECGLKLAAGSSDGCISILSRNQDDSWDLPEKFTAHDMGINAVAWAPLVNLEDLASQSNYDKFKGHLRLASASCDTFVKIWKYDTTLKKWECEDKLQQHTEWVRDVAWCPSIGNNYDLIATCSEDQTVVLWKYYGKEKMESEVLKKYEGPVWRVSWSLTGNMLSVSAANNNSEVEVEIFEENEVGKWELLSSVNKEKNL